mgnify:CR=1 FL=1
MASILSWNHISANMSTNMYVEKKSVFSTSIGFLRFTMRYNLVEYHIEYKHYIQKMWTDVLAFKVVVHTWFKAFGRLFVGKVRQLHR